MSTPVPTPRTEAKKPIPTPRRTINPQTVQQVDATSGSPSKLDDRTFTRRVKSASKQIAGDIGDLVQDRKKAVIEGTRQSVRRITRHFSFSQQGQSVEEDKPAAEREDKPFDDIFNNIKFDSPLTVSEGIYNNLEETSSNDSLNLPPPSHPPPPLPDDSIYDAPQSIASSSNSGKSNSSVPPHKPKRKNAPPIPAYESVFPLPNSDSDSCIDMTEKALDQMSLSRSASWTFYDSVNESTPSSKSDEEKQENAGISVPLVPEVVDKSNVDLNSNIDTASSIEMRNSMYENHEIVQKVAARPSQSVLMMFDPLLNNPVNANIPDYDLKSLEELLQGDLYGTISNANTIDDWSISNESETEEFVSPPTPPMRFDSLPDEDTPAPVTTTAPSAPPKTRTSWFTSSEPKTPTENKKNWFKQVLEKTPEIMLGVKANKDHVVDRPLLGMKNFVQKRGMLYKVQSGPVEDLFGEYSGRWCVLENSNFICFSDNTCDNVKEHFPSQTILSIQLLHDSKFKYKQDNEELHCFELNTTGKTRGGHVYGSRSISERRLWMQHLAEGLTSKFTTKITSDYLRMGWAYIREGVSAKWIGAWIILRNRKLYYATDSTSVKSMDLRKARCIVLQIYQESDNNPRTNDKGPNMLIDCPGLVLYLRMWTTRETKVWCNLVKLAAHNNGPNLVQQQLTKDNVPVIVEKCINFVYAHGSMSEGIYRRTGTTSAVAGILTKFLKDAFAVQLTIDQSNEFEVATALKRFFRDLPEPLLGSNHREYLYQVSKQNNLDDKIRMYKAALEQLPPISFKTTKKLMGHLHFISTQSHKNLMNVDNLAAIWGPTLMHQTKAQQQTTSIEKDSVVVGQLIEHYRLIFAEDADEIEREKLMLSVLERCSRAPQGTGNKNAGDLRIWVYLRNKEGRTFHISVGPNRTAYDVCLELSKHLKLEAHETILEEVVLNESLRRPLHQTEKVLDVVLRWSYWDQQDRKDNYLVINSIHKYAEFMRNEPVPVSGELKFADNRTKHFKLFMFDFSQAKLSLVKDKGQLYSWRIEDIVWYFGHEPKRNPQSKYTITFFELEQHPKRSKNVPYFGNILAWSDATIRALWVAAMLKARYPVNFVPPLKTENLLSL